jgi:Protein of unknown function (DUF4238)
MALDHFVSQVHLRNFFSPALGERLYAIRKSNGKTFTPGSGAICGIRDGSTNAFLERDRVVEEFLNTIEPNYDAAVKRLSEGSIDPECVYVIAGFAAYIATCSPAGMRIQAEPLKAELDSVARILDRTGMLPPPPAALNGKNIAELLDNGTLRLFVDHKFPQAIGIQNMLGMTAMFGNANWEIMHNHCEDSRFFTSDFPLAIEQSGNSELLNRVLPLTPRLAVRIRANAGLRKRQRDLDFAHFRYRVRTLTRSEVRAVNRLVVQCAEDLILYSDDRPWVKPFVAKYSRYHLRTITERFGDPRAAFLKSRLQIVERDSRQNPVDH